MTADARRRTAAGRLLALCLALALAGPGAAGADDLGDPERGAKVFRRCQSCHAVGPDAANKVGPHLNELFGRRAGSVEGYSGYSGDLVRAGQDGLHWTAEKLHIYIENPKSLVSQTRMRFAGISDPDDRADLIAFLRTYSASPRDIPEAPPTARHVDPVLPDSLAVLQGDAEFGEYLASECVTCHRADGADEGIPSITGWPSHDFAVALNAYRVKARPHPVMQMLTQNLSDEEIAALAAYFATLGE